MIRLTVRFDLTDDYTDDDIQQLLEEIKDEIVPLIPAYFFTEGNWISATGRPMSHPFPFQLTCAHADTCLPDYWGGHHLPHLSIPVQRGMTLTEVKEALLSELNQGAILGSIDADALLSNDKWYHAAVNAIQALEQSDPTQTGLFLDLEDVQDPDHEVHAYFVFA